MLCFMPQPAAAVSLLALVAAFPALGAEIEAKSKIDAVTVYPDAAAVTRSLEIDLPAGATTLVFKGLPIGIDPASLRVEGAGTGRLLIGAVETRAAPAPARPVDTAIEAKLKSLRGDREGIQAQLEALEAKKAMMTRFSQSGPEKLSPEGKPADIGQWSAAWDAVGQGLAKAGEDLRIVRAKARDTDEEIRGLEQARQRPLPQSGAARDVIVAVDADAAQKGRLALTYRIAGAGWQPLYDARLDTSAAGGKAALELVRRADVTQRTGEDWSGVTLSVSTVRARRGTQAPDVLTQRLAFYEPHAAAQGGLIRRDAPAPASAPSIMNDKAADESRKRDESLPSRPQMRQAEEQQADAEAGAFQASFLIPGRIDVPADGSHKTFRISAVKLNPDLLARAAPALDETAYLQARIINSEDAPLLPGTVNILRDGGFVGTGRIAFTAPGDSTDIGFGADDRVKISRVPVRRKENEPSWTSSTKTEQREFRISVKNLHPFAIKVAVTDQIPISENSAIVIEQLAATTAPTEKIVNDRRGVMGWTYDVAPNETKNITLAYRMKWPADREVVFQSVPNGPGAQPR